MVKNATLLVAGPLMRQLLDLPEDCELPWTVEVPIAHKDIPDGADRVLALFQGCCGETKFARFEKA